MALTAYRLVVNGESRTLADWGVEAASLQLGLCGDDSLSLSHASAITAAPLFAGLAVAELYDAGRRVFRGVVFPRRDGFRMHYQVQGANYYLGTTIVQDLPFLVDDTFVLTEVSKYLLGQGTLAQNITDLVAQVADQGAPLAVDFSLLPELPEDGRPQEAQRDLTALEAIRRIFAYSPHLTWYWDYSSDPVKLVTCSVLRAGHGFTGLPANSDVHTVPASRIEQDPAPTFNPRYDLLRRKVVVYFQGWESVQVNAEGEATETGAPALAMKLTTEEAVVENGAFGQTTYCIELTKGAFNGGGYDADEEPIEGLADRLLAPYASLWLELGWSEIGEGCNFDVQPGQLWSATGVDPAYTNAQALCRSVAHDLAHGQTRIECGPPSETLGFMEPQLANRIRNLQSRSESGGTNWGFEPDDQGNEDSAGNVSFTVLWWNGSEWRAREYTGRGTMGSSDVESTLGMIVKLTGSEEDGPRKVLLPYPSTALS